MKLRKFKNKLFAILNLVFADEYFIFTYENTRAHKYDMEFRSSTPVPHDMVALHNNELFPLVAESHGLKAMEANLNKAKDIIKK